MTTKIHGLRDVGQLKLYEKHTGSHIDTFISKQVDSRKLMRVKITRQEARNIAFLPKSNFVETCMQHLEGAKRAGSVNYFES